ncbi:MAG: peptidoglycan DD-metalloendopeptidase family protein [Flavobacteriales bacterium]|nr:peptidoglycan DD-metalloendopeptidase family protein [Flavobacteriales bacterium]
MKKDSILKRIKKRFTARLKFIVFDQEMLHEIFSIRVRPINLFFSLLTVAVLLIVGTVLLIRYTPLKNYVNTDDLPHLRRQTAELLYRLDSLSSRQDINEAFILSMRDVVAGNVSVEEFKDSAYVDSISRTAREKIFASGEDSAYRVAMEKRLEDARRGAEEARNILSFSTPMRGAVITVPYDYTTDETYIAIDAGANMPVFAMLAGTVLYRDWSPESGNVMIIQHGENIVTVYKNLGLIAVAVGERISQGEQIAMSGSASMSNTSVYFELWINGKPVNPEDYINFEM